MGGYWKDFGEDLRDNWKKFRDAFEQDGPVRLLVGTAVGSFLAEALGALAARFGG